MTEAQLLEAASAGDEGAYAELVEPHRRLLHAHCYRMLGSVHDAEDAVQDTLLRAWRSLSSFQGRSSLRSWLYTIATNVCLRAIERRPARVLPVDYGPPADPHEPLGEPLVESTWIEPYADEQLGLDDGLAGPEARYEQRESIELAFIAESATLAMPTTPAWFRGRDAVVVGLRAVPLSAGPQWRLTPTRASGQLAARAYLWDGVGGSFVLRHVAVLTLRGALIDEITAFIDPSTSAPAPFEPAGGG